MVPEADLSQPWAGADQRAPSSPLLPSPPSQQPPWLRKVCYARILDSKRKFLEAGTRYYQLSQLQGKSFGARTVSETELTQALLQAVTCAILAPAGPQRSRLLGTLYKDERSSRLPSHGVLEKMFMERLLRKVSGQ